MKYFFNIYFSILTSATQSVTISEIDDFEQKVMTVKSIRESSAP